MPTCDWPRPTRPSATARSCGTCAITWRRTTGAGGTYGKCVATGVLGGSFDPVHHGHLIAADRAAEALGLDTVLFVPCARQPLKPEPPAATSEQRLPMLRLAIGDYSRFAVETSELKRPVPSYPGDTLRQSPAQ